MGRQCALLGNQHRSLDRPLLIIPVAGKNRHGAKNSKKNNHAAAEIYCSRGMVVVGNTSAQNPEYCQETVYSPLLPPLL